MELLDTKMKIDPEPLKDIDLNENEIYNLTPQKKNCLDKRVLIIIIVFVLIISSITTYIFLLPNDNLVVEAEYETSVDNELVTLVSCNNDFVFEVEVKGIKQELLNNCQFRAEKSGTHNVVLKFKKIPKMEYLFSLVPKLTRINRIKGKPPTIAYLFYLSLNLKSADLSDLDTSDITNMTSAFKGALNLVNVTFGKKFTTKNLLSMSHMFNGCVKLSSVKLTNFDTSNVETINNMFENCRELSSIDLSNFHTSNLKDMKDLFRNNRRLKYINMLNFETNHLNISYLDIISGTNNIESICINEGNNVQLITSMKKDHKNITISCPTFY